MRTASLLGRLPRGISIVVFALSIALGASQGARSDEADAAAVSPQDPAVAISVAGDAVIEAPASYAGETASAHPVADAIVVEFAVTPVDDAAQTSSAGSTEAALTEASISSETEAIDSSETEATEAASGQAVVSYPDVEITIAAGEVARAYPAESASIETAPATELIAAASDQDVAIAQQDPQYTGSIAQWDGSAVVSYPDVEVTIAVSATSFEDASLSDE